MKPPFDDAVPMSERDMGILKVLEEEELDCFSFEGLKRRAGTHPETLSRVLSRLEEQNIVERAEDGYRVTATGRDYLMVHPAEAVGERLTLLKTLLPPNSDLRQTFAALKGRWFGRLRWLGYSEDAGDLVMKWVTDDGKVQLSARFTQAELTIEARLLQGRELANAVRSAHSLLAHIAVAASPRSRRLLLEVIPSPSVPN
jgi:DNA-binding transcriptional ArsR family regulator